MQKQIKLYVDIYMSPYLCGYRKGYKAQCDVTTMIENGREKR